LLGFAALAGTDYQHLVGKGSDEVVALLG